MSTSPIHINAVGTAHLDDQSETDAQEERKKSFPAIKTPKEGRFQMPWIKSLFVACFLLSFAGSGERFGDKAFSGVQLHPAYQRHLGHQHLDEDHRFPTIWASVIDPGDCIGQIVGALLAGWLCEAFGRFLSFCSGSH